MAVVPFEERKTKRFPGRNVQVFTGTVVKERDNGLFDFVSRGKKYNVYSINKLPRRLDKNDLVRVEGKRFGENDIRNARVSIIRNR